MSASAGIAAPVSARRTPRCLLLTGATGSLGRYLLRDLLVAGHQVAILVRDSATQSAAERAGSLMAFWSQKLGQELPAPTVIAGDLCLPQFGLSHSEYDGLADWCDAIVHAAASLAFHPTPMGEPWKTNVAGTQRLLEFCRRTRKPEFHFVSTAYVCGETTATAFEDGPQDEPAFRNAYEGSKFEAERLLRASKEVRTTVYRPSVIVGDSRTGYTSSYEGIYRFWELGARLSGPGRTGARFTARLPWTGAEPRNLVAVDWVSSAIVQLLSRPECHGRTYHLVARNPVPVHLLKEVADEELKLVPWRLAGPDVLQSLTSIETMLLEHCREYAPYLVHDPDFDRRHLDAALPDFAEATLDREALGRLIRFAVADHWGRRGPGSRRHSAPRPAELNCADYMERFFPAVERQIGLSRLAGLNVLVSVEIRGAGGGNWSCRWIDGELSSVTRTLDADADVRFATDDVTFASIILGRLSPQEAFQARRLRVAGNLEVALKLGMLFTQFLKKSSYRPDNPEEYA